MLPKKQASQKARPQPSEMPRLKFEGDIFAGREPDNSIIQNESEIVTFRQHNSHLLGDTASLDLTHTHHSEQRPGQFKINRCLFAEERLAEQSARLEHVLLENIIDRDQPDDPKRLRLKVKQLENQRSIFSIQKINLMKQLAQLVRCLQGLKRGMGASYAVIEKSKLSPNQKSKIGVNIARMLQSIEGALTATDPGVKKSKALLEDSSRFNRPESTHSASSTLRSVSKVKQPLQLAIPTPTKPKTPKTPKQNIFTSTGKSPPSSASKPRFLEDPRAEERLKEQFQKNQREFRVARGFSQKGKQSYLQLQKGDLVKVLAPCQGGVWIGMIGDKIGFFPIAVLQSK